MQYAFNAQQFQPQYGNSAFPVGTYKGVISNTEGKDVVRNGQTVGGLLELSIEVIDGPMKGKVMYDRLNLHHANPQTVEIANKQLSAYCHVTGVYAFQNTQELCGKPFQFEVGYQIDRDTKQPTAFTEVKALFDINGNAPGKAGAGPQSQGQPQPGANTAPAAGVGPAGGQGGWGQGGNGGNAQPGAGAAQGDQGAGAGNGGGWGQGGAQPGAGAGAGQGGGWAQSAGQGGGAPGWGQR